MKKLSFLFLIMISQIANAKDFRFGPNIEAINFSTGGILGAGVAIQTYEHAHIRIGTSMDFFGGIHLGYGFDAYITPITLERFPPITPTLGVDMVDYLKMISITAGLLINANENLVLGLRFSWIVRNEYGNSGITLPTLRGTWFF